MPVLRLPRWVAGRPVGGVLLVLLVGLVLAGPLVASARASTSASAAAAFIESAQNPDGGFSATYGGPTKSGGSSSPSASLWATVALLAAGKNPADEALNNGSSAQEYLSEHLSAFRTLTDFGLLALIQSASGANAALYGTPATALRTDLTAAEVHADPAGAAMGVLGLVASHDTAAARSAAETLLSDQAADGGWAESGTDPSAATALALEALAATDLTTSATGASAVNRALGYLQHAQINDGSIAQSDASATTGSGDVAATAFTLQALAALKHPQLKTSTGVTVAEGLSNYQQQSGNGAGGLSPYGSYDTGVAPSVTQTAQAYAAFDGMTFPLPFVAATPPPTVTTTPSASATTPAPVNRASTGSSHQGISAAGTGPKHSGGAYQGASAAGKTGAKAAPRHRATAPSSGTQVTGSVVGTTPPPKLTSAAGRPPAKDHSAVYLMLALLVIGVAGVALELRRPRRSERSGVAVAVARADRFGRWFGARGSWAPALAGTVGLVLVLVPVVSGMWSRAPRAATMLSAFRPYMGSAHLARLQSDVGVMAKAFAETGRLGAVKGFAHGQWPGIHRAFADTLKTVVAQRGHYDTLDGLPSFQSFPWFLLIPGLLLILAATVAIWHPALWGRVRWAVAVIGAALVIAPLTSGLFGAGDQGASLVTAFAGVESRSNVKTLQTGFSDLVIGESDVSGAVSGAAAARRYPAAMAFEHRFTAILGDFTPLLGVMSDNVANYRAVAALPDFQIFPWLFAIPGLVALALAFFGVPRGLRLRRFTPATSIPSNATQGAPDAT